MTDTNDAPAAGDGDISHDLFMKHLHDIKGDLFPHMSEAQLVDTKAAPAEILKPKVDPKVTLMQRPEYTFQFGYTDPRGKQWSGSFTNRILTIGQRIQVGTMRARMCAGITPESFSQETYDLIYMLTWLQQSLIAKPEWANDLISGTDEVLMQTLFETVQLHESTFREPRKPAAAGA